MPCLFKLVNLTPRGELWIFKWQWCSNGCKNRYPKNSHAKFPSLIIWLLNRCNLMRQMLKQPQNNATGKFGHYHESWDCFKPGVPVWTQKTPYLNQITQKNTSQIFQPKKIRQSKISNPKKTFDHPRYREIWSTALGFKNARKGMLRTREERASLFTPLSTGN